MLQVLSEEVICESGTSDGTGKKTGGYGEDNKDGDE